jgi:hypothetical protein
MGLVRARRERRKESLSSLLASASYPFELGQHLDYGGWYRRALELCGAGAPRVVEEECRAKGGAGCRYRLRWS